MTSALKRFRLFKGWQKLELLTSDIHDWNITFVDTGLHVEHWPAAECGQEISHGEKTFLANYTDGLSDLPLPQMIEDFEKQNSVAAFVGVKPNASFHMIEMDGKGLVKDIRHVADCNQRINGGFFAFRQEIFDYLKEGEELVQQPFQRLIAAQRLIAYPHNGFWACMDTVKEVQQLEELHAQGRAPWEVWKAR